MCKILPFCLIFAHWFLIREIENTLFSQEKKFSLDFLHLCGYYYYKKTSKISRSHVLFCTLFLLLMETIVIATR